VFIQDLWYCITKTSQSMLFRAIICLFESITKYINILCGQLERFCSKAGDAYICRCTVKVKTVKSIPSFIWL
jgi:hypothetical protein